MLSNILIKEKIRFRQTVSSLQWELLDLENSYRYNIE